MTLSELYDVDARRLTLVCIVGEAPLEGVISANWAFNIGSVPTATIVIADRDPPLAYHDPVTIDCGFDGVTERVFTGVVLDIGRSGRNVTIECVGQSWVLDTEYHTLVKTLSNIDAADAVTEMLQAAGANLYGFFVDLPTWQLATLKDRPLSFQTYSDAIMKIAEVLLARWFETPSGLVVVREAQPVPGIFAVRSYFSMELDGLVESYPAGITSGRPRLRNASMKTAHRDVKNQILVLGSSVTTVDAGGNQVSARIQAAVLGPNQLVLSPDNNQAYNALVFSNELIETQARADEVAVDLFQLHSRLTTYMDATIDGDPRVRLGETLQIEDPAYTGATGRWWLEGYRTSVSATGFSTALQLIQKEGARTNWEPVADFIVSMERQWIADAGYFIMVTLDGRASYDFDGEIVSYAWTDNQFGVVNGSTAIRIFRIDPDDYIGLTWNVTLEVTDNDGAQSLCHEDDNDHAPTESGRQCPWPRVLRSMLLHRRRRTAGSSGATRRLRAVL